MKKIYFAFAALLLSVASCNVADEWGPVFTPNEYPDESPQLIMNRTITIAELCGMYTQGQPWRMTGNHVIEGKVISSDQDGNFYKSFYIQDETAGIEIKIGRNGLYNDYKEGQTIYVKCNDLYLGMYGGKGTSSQGMVQIGHKDPSGDYETSYLEAPLLIDTHVIRGEIGERVQPEVLNPSDFPTSAQHQKDNRFVGRLVTVKDLKYTWFDPQYKETNRVFALLYPDSNRPHKSTDPENRLFLSGDNTWNVNTWAMSKALVVKHLKDGDWDSAEIGSGNTKFGPMTNAVSETGMFKDEAEAAKAKGETLTYKDLLIKNAAAASVSQYFSASNGTGFQIRTSGFCKFSDTVIPEDILSGKKNINVTGVLCMYEGKMQIVINRLEDITYADGTPLYK